MTNRTTITALACTAVIVCTAAWLALRNADTDAAPPPSPAASSAPIGSAWPEAASAGTSDVVYDPEAERQPRRALPTPASSRSGRTVRGRVVFASGQPAAEVTVAIATDRTETTADGAFQLECTSDDAALVATRIGHEPTVVAAVATQPEVVEGRELTVVLLGPALTITGWLVQTDGTPCAGWHLDLHGGGTYVDTEGADVAGLGAPLRPMFLAEDLAAGAHEESLGGWTLAKNPNDQRVGADGAFSIGGLRTGCDYVLRARNETTLQTVKSLPIRAGTQGLRFVVPEGSWRERVHGRVIDRNGGAIAGVRVRLTMRVHRNGNGETYETGQEDRTWANGQFTFTHVPHEDLLLRFDQGDIESLYHAFPATDPGNDLLITLSSPCRFRCEPAANLPAPTTLRVLDEHQCPLRVGHEVRPGHSTGGLRLAMPALGGEFQVSDRAAWLVFEVDEQEIRRLPLRLRRGEATLVRG
jgi:hypothetical protein